MALSHCYALNMAGVLLTCKHQISNPGIKYSENKERNCIMNENVWAHAVYLIFLNFPLG